MSITDKTAKFRAMHKPGAPFIIPNPWDVGSARILEAVGFQALATTSSGFAMTMGAKDYGITRDAALAHARDVANAVEIAVTADLENGWGRAPEDAAKTISLACDTGLVGGSIEDATYDEAAPVFERAEAVDRVAAAVEAAKASNTGFVLTARAEAYLYGCGVLDEIIARLNAFAEVGADVLYAPGLPDMDAVRAVCQGVDKPVNVLLIGNLANHSMEAFAEAGAARLSVGGTLAWKAYSGLVEAKSMLENGTFGALQLDKDKTSIVGGVLK